MTEILWRPSNENIAMSAMTAYQDWIVQKTGEKISNYSKLHRWSTENLTDFWTSLFDYFDLIYEGELEPATVGDQMPGIKWFPNIRVNYAENILERGRNGIAIQALTESDDLGREITYEELRNDVSRCARGLKQLGIQAGDRVAGYTANVPEAMIASLATASIGAIWSSASPDFGLEALCDRLGQVRPRVVFASTHYAYKGRHHQSGAVVSKIQDRIDSVEHIVSISYPEGEAERTEGIEWNDFLGPKDSPDIEYHRGNFSHPLYILFSSGTTGVPKCIVHSGGGVLLQHAKEMFFHANLKAEDKLFYFTTCGWMMWNWLLSGLLTGARIVCYDGSPAYPDISRLWKMARDLQITHFGTSGKHIESSMKLLDEEQLGSLNSLPATRSVMYTGSPLSAEGYKWVYSAIKDDVHLAGISGGTDIVSCFVLGNPNDAVRAGRIQVPGLGVDVAALNDNGDAVMDEAGELVCRQPIPSMPVAFYNDKDGERYRKAYFDVYPGIWRHGDYVTFFTEGGIEIHGRSDATLNPGGVRIGSAEIYAALDTISEVVGGLAVGWKRADSADEQIVLFVQVLNDLELDESLIKTIRSGIRDICSPKHVPSYVFSLSAIPITRSGKPVELSVKAILAGKDIKNRAALANPEVLEEIELAARELRALSNP